MSFCDNSSGVGAAKEGQLGVGETELVEVKDTQSQHEDSLGRERNGKWW